ncbi:hypothetical protein BV22DRAFT_1134173 [Leucogyrophana mollusca]|uniref:Uncharacterized protein n=1 Tax=Leucogyrophana mollusca TaxID=85980 RepID=A0ACB8B012_9AGAM|nr:hypothetical protein BV22DRAFT_1134173 [Leucogyrophana mollusca]
MEVDSSSGASVVAAEGSQSVASGIPSHAAPGAVAGGGMFIFGAGTSAIPATVNPSTVAEVTLDANTSTFEGGHSMVAVPNAAPQTTVADGGMFIFGAGTSANPATANPSTIAEVTPDASNTSTVEDGHSIATVPNAAPQTLASVAVAPAGARGPVGLSGTHEAPVSGSPESASTTPTSTIVPNVADGAAEEVTSDAATDNTEGADEYAPWVDRVAMVDDSGRKLKRLRCT